MKPVVATYRIQLNRHFTLQDLIARVDYLHALNISHLYLSPVMESVPGSDHGYDVIDFSEVSRERGGEEGLRALDRKLRSLTPRMHMILDIVPNHMAACLDNKYWRDVLTRGAASGYWSFFDLRIDARGKIEIPVLWDSVEALTAAGHIRLALDDAEIVAYCGDRAYPVTAESQARLRRDFEGSRKKALADYLATLPPAPVSEILGAQHYVFVEAAGASRAASYRRFFDIAGLVALRMEDPYVFEVTHRKVFEIVRELPSIAGLRIDHVDGLADPVGYLRELAAEMPNVWVEKILARHEIMHDWPCRGTTGYEFIDRLNLLMVDAKGFQRIERRWKAQETEWRDFGDCVRSSKEEALDRLFPAELDRLAALLRGDTQYDTDRLRAAIRRLTAVLPVYRVYGAEAGDGREWLAKATKQMPKRTTREQRRVVETLLEPRDGAERRFSSEWQRLTGAAMAKGLEDRAHYRYTPLTALNEVGCMPVVAETSRRDFAKWLERRQEHRPQCLNAGTTHDTKRSEDVRHRLYVLADIPDLWDEYTRRAMTILTPPPELRPATVLFFLQALVGTWPHDGAPTAHYADRLWQYMQKAAREAALDTAWSWPDKGYETILEEFVRKALEEPALHFATQRLMRTVAPAGAINSLSALTLRALSTGVPDIYQGTEVWSLALVDPDNRAPVDFEALEDSLKRRVTDGPDPRRHLAGVVAGWRDGTVKMWLLRELLKIRRGFLRAAGENYGIATLPVTGPTSECLAGFLLSGGGRQLAVVVPRYPGRLLKNTDGIGIGGADWGETALTLPRAETVFNLLTGRTLASAKRVFARELFRELPVAVLQL